MVRMLLTEEGVSSMRKPLGRSLLVAALGSVLALMLVGPAQAASTYEITVTVTDNTTSAVNVFHVFEGQAGRDVTDPTSPNAVNTINIGGTAWAAFQTTTGLTLSGFNSVTNNPGAIVATMSLGGTVQVTSTSNTDSYTVQVQVSQQGFTSPLGPIGNLSDSESSTISNTTGNPGGGKIPPDMQSIQSWYDNTDTLNGVPGTAHTPLGSYGLPQTLNTTKSLSGPTLSTVFSPATASPFSLTERIVVNITGNGGSPYGAQAKDVFGGTLTLTAVPEPSSVILMLSSVPLPLVVVGIRRRRAAMAG